MENKLNIEQGNNKRGTMQYSNDSPYHISRVKNIKRKNFLIRQLCRKVRLKV